MEKPTKVEPHLGVVVWYDAKGDSLKQLTLDDVHLFHMPTVMQTLGWIMKDDEKGVTIANERCLDVGDETYRSPTFIPRVLVRSVTPFKLSSPPKRKKNAKSPVDSAVVADHPAPPEG